MPELKPTASADREQAFATLSRHRTAKSLLSQGAVL